MPSGEDIFNAELDLIDRVTRFVCRRNHLSSVNADDFASHARLKLMEDGYAILGKFQGRSSLKTFLSITIQRIFLDYRNAAWGKWRPSAEALKRGPAAVLLEQLVSRDGYTFDEAFEIITTNHRVSVARPDLERLAAALPVRAKRRFETDEVLLNVPSGASADAGTWDLDRREAAGRIGTALQDLLITLPAQDRLILRARFEDGRSVRDIAEMLRLEQKPLYRRVERLLRDLRAGLEARGIGAADVNDLIGDVLIELDADDRSPETDAARPSIARGADAWP